MLLFLQIMLKSGKTLVICGCVPLFKRRSCRTGSSCITCVIFISFLPQDLHSQGEVIACLEKALVREAEQQDKVHQIRDECKKAIMRVAELSSDDFHLDRYLYFSCRDDRERFCENVHTHTLLLTFLTLNKIRSASKG